MASFGDVDRNVTITFIGRDNASRAMSSIGSSASRTSKTVMFLTKMLKAAAIAAATALAAAAAAGAYALFQLGKQSIESASTLNESINAVKVTWGKAADDILKQSKQAAEGLGLARSEFNAISVQFSSFATTIAGKGGDAAATLDELTTRGADFASVMDLEVNEALRLFQSGLAGETEPLRKFGIDLSAAAVTAFALKKGIAESADSMTEAQKVQARYALLMKQTDKAAGDFKNTSGSLANSQRRLTANWENAKAAIGKGLLPVMQSLVNWANDNLVPWIKRTMVPAFKQFTRWIQNEAVPWIQKKLIPALQDMWTWFKERIAPALKSAWDEAEKLVRNVVDLGKAWGGSDGATTKLEDGATSVEGLAEALAPTVSLLNSLVAAAEWLETHGEWISRLNEAAGALNVVGQAKFLYDSRPGFLGGDEADGGWLKRAQGGWGRGWTMVGEHGPELISNRGFVKPHSASMGGNGGGGNVFHIHGAVDPVGTARQIRAILAKGDRASGRGALGLA